MTSGDNQRTWGEPIKAITSVIVLMISVFTLLGIFLPAGLTQPIGTVIIGLIGTAILVRMGKLNWGGALLTWVAVSVGLIMLYLIVSRPATVVGVVVDSSGAPVKGLALVLTDANGVDHKTVSDEDGAFEINNVSEGKFTILANGELLISGQVPSGWKRIMAPQVNIGSPVYRPGPTVAVVISETPTPTPVVPTDTPLPPPTPTPTPIPPTPTETPTIVPTDTPSPSPTPTEMPISTNTPTPTFTPTATPTYKPVSPTPEPIAQEVVDVTVAFYPSGWMGDWGDITLDDAWMDNPHSVPTCIKITYSATQSQGNGWAGIYWQYPDRNWGDNPDGRDLTGATKLTFWVRGERGGEKAEFKVGGITGNYPDSIQPPVSTGVIILSSEWRQYTIDLTGKDLSHVIGGFVWVTNKNQNPSGSTIYLDDIRYE